MIRSVGASLVVTADTFDWLAPEAHLVVEDTLYEARFVSSEELAGTDVAGLPVCSMEVEKDASVLLEEDEVLATEFGEALGFLLTQFPGTRRIRVCMLMDPEDEEAEPHLVAEVAGPLARREFRAACRRFFEALFRTGHKRIHAVLTILQD